MIHWRRLLLVAPILSLSLVHVPAGAEETPPGLCEAIDEADRDSVVEILHGTTVDPARIATVLEPNATYTSPISGVVSGRDAVVEAFAGLKASFTGLTLAADAVLVDDPYVVVRYTLSGTHDGEFAGVAATGGDVEATGIAVYRMHCGMVGEAWTHFDQLGITGQIDSEIAAYAPAEPMAAPAADHPVPRPPART